MELHSRVITLYKYQINISHLVYQNATGLLFHSGEKTNPGVMVEKSAKNTWTLVTMEVLKSKRWKKGCWSKRCVFKVYKEEVRTTED